MSQLLLYLLCVLIVSVKADDCRTVQFQPEIKGKFLENHMIRSMEVQIRTSCEMQCCQEPNCVSYNYDPIDSDNPSCDLNNRNHLQAPSGDFVPKDKFIFRYILNTCLSSPCPSNTTCQVGFGDKGYRCAICPVGYYGDNCDLVLPQCQPSWIAFQGKCYKLLTEIKSWNDAKTFCISIGAQLVKIESAGEDAFLANEFLAGTVDYWIGLTDVETENDWKWSDGSELTGYTNWMSGQPNNYNNGQHCGGIRKGEFFGNDYDGEWHDDTCSASKHKGFICEK